MLAMFVIPNHAREPYALRAPDSRLRTSMVGSPAFRVTGLA
jgi:hypothetical protein